MAIKLDLSYVYITYVFGTHTHNQNARNLSQKQLHSRSTNCEQRQIYDHKTKSNNNCSVMLQGEVLEGVDFYIQGVRDGNKLAGIRKATISYIVLFFYYQQCYAF